MRDLTARAKDVIKCRSFQGEREAEFTVQQIHDPGTSVGADRDPFDRPLRHSA
jgi:hypothetical protein